MVKKERATNSTVQSKAKVEKVLVENFVSLQKVMTNLAVKFDNLSGQISKLLELFEISAKTLAEKGGDEKEKKIVEKMDSLLEQNKVIARGIALLHERNIPEQPMPNQPMQRIQYPSRQPINRPSEFSKNPKFRRMA